MKPTYAYVAEILLTALVPLAFMPTAAAEQQSGKADYQRGEALLKQAITTEAYYPLAYYAFSRAAAIEPSNKKYQKKKAEVGGLLSDKALSEAKGVIDKDLTAAKLWLGKSLTFNPDNDRAKELSHSLDQRITVARTTLELAQAAAYRGDTDVAAKLLESLNTFRTRDESRESLLSFEKVDREQENARMAVRLRQLWKDGKTDAALDTLSQLGTGQPDGSFASTTSLEMRSTIFDNLVARAQAAPTKTVAGLVERTKLLQMASKADPSSNQIRTLISESFDQLNKSLARSITDLKTTRETFAGRMRLGFSATAFELVGVNGIGTPRSLSE